MITLIEIRINDDIYPQKLREIKNPPLKLYAIGNVKLLNETGIAVVGTRNITEYGEKIAKKFVKELALRDITIISGLAIGVDTVAHCETLKSSGKTIAILGSGFDNIYPVENKKLFNEIVENDGLVLSEFPPNVRAQSKNFPTRNRIISGLSDAILVIEAAYRSGTSITVRYANEQHKKVYAIPRKIR